MNSKSDKTPSTIRPNTKIALELDIKIISNNNINEV